MAVKVYIVYYSMFGQIEKLAVRMQEGVNSVKGVEATLWQVPEILTDEERHLLGAPQRSDVPIIHPNQLSEADGFIFCFPTRSGTMAVQFKNFLESTEEPCNTLRLAGKPAGVFTNVGSQGGEQETTVLNDIATLANHGMILVSFGLWFTYSHEFGNTREVHSGCSYGAAGKEGPTFFELMYAFDYGYYFANITKQIKEDS